MVISTVAMPDDSFVKELRAQAKSFSGSKPQNNSDLIFFGAAKSAELARARQLIPSLNSAGALWIVYPKGRQEITELQVLDAGRAAGLVDVKVVSFSATHTALKFVRSKVKAINIAQTTHAYRVSRHGRRCCLKRSLRGVRSALYPLRAGGQPCHAARAGNTAWRGERGPSAALRSCRSLWSWSGRCAPRPGQSSSCER